MGNVNNIRKTIRMLQEIPLVTSFFVLVVYCTDIYGHDLCKYIYPLFGFSSYIMFRLYLVARKMYVSKWALVLYIMLISISFVELFHNIFPMCVKSIIIQHLLNIIFVTGVISSFITFLYGKYKDASKQHH